MSSHTVLDPLLELFRLGGPAVMGPLCVALLILWYALGYRAMLLLRGDPRPADLLIAEALAGRLQAPRGIIARAVARSVKVVRAASGDRLALVEAELFQDRRELGRFAGLVQDIVRAAPLLGLLGTVVGMIETFGSMAEQTMFSRSGGIAGGISEALITTEMGLLVAVPGLLFGRLLARRQELLQAELDRVRDVLAMEAGS